MPKRWVQLTEVDCDLVMAVDRRWSHSHGKRLTDKNGQRRKGDTHLSISEAKHVTLHIHRTPFPGKRSIPLPASLLLPCSTPSSSSLIFSSFQSPPPSISHPRTLLPFLFLLHKILSFRSNTLDIFRLPVWYARQTNMMMKTTPISQGIKVGRAFIGLVPKRWDCQNMVRLPKLYTEQNPNFF